MTATRRALPKRRAILVAVSVVLFIVALATQLAASPPAPPPASLAAELEPASWAMNVPTAWLAASAPRLRAGDLLDILAVKQGDHAYAVPVAYAVAVVSVDDHGLVLEVNEDDASAIAVARGGGLLLVPLLRSAR